MGVQLRNRIPCGGYGAPEDLLRLRTSFSPGGSSRVFVVSRYRNERCEVDVWECHEFTDPSGGTARLEIGP